MNIKGLLLGSAAALVAVSGARAADAVVIAEPEPMEYVRICDTYGAGFYYIPGTETCLKFSGYMRYLVGVGSAGNEDVIDKSDFYDLLAAEAAGEDPDIDDYLDTNDTYSKTARFQLRVDARQETELGTLRAYAAVNFNYSTGTDGISVLGVNVDPSDFTGGIYGVTTSSDNVAIEHAYIELGGFRAGKTDTLFNTFTGFAGNVYNDEIGVDYGPGGTHQLSYTFTGGNGFSAAIALETGTGYGGFIPASLLPNPAIAAIVNSVVQADLYAIDSYVPNVVGGIGYTAGWGSVTGVAAYDSVWETWAGKVRADFNATEALSLWVMGGLKDDEDVFNYYAPWSGSWAVWGGGSFAFNEKAAFNLQVGYDDGQNFGVAANIDYTLVNNFVITPEVNYSDNFDADDADAWGGWLKLQYNWGS
ncbi:MAG: porin [Mesorhizobium sp.]|nr:porin [Mesorhizobium sp.]MBL8580236.1 porin [Mesorhizobium sp.]